MPALPDPSFIEVLMTPARDDLTDVTRQVPSSDSHLDGFDVKELAEDAEKKIDQIEMIGEETAAGFRPSASQISPGMRYLHSSRTIHQLVGDRNRAVGIFLAVATVLWTASAAVMNAHDDPAYIIPLSTVKRWCMPLTFAVLTVLAIFMSLLLTRTRVGLIYEVAKMNVLLGLPVGRVKRIQPFSIFFIMQALISLAGGCSAALLTAQLLWLAEMGRPGLIAFVVGAAVCAALMLLYVGVVKHTTSDEKLQSGR
jgi:hypothetical protein